MATKPMMEEEEPVVAGKSLTELVDPNAGVPAEADAEELAETPAEEAAEGEEGELAEELNPAVKVPEKFQQAVDSMVMKASKHELDYLQNCIREREKQLNKAESKPERSATFDTEGMPE